MRAKLTIRVGWQCKILFFTVLSPGFYGIMTMVYDISEIKYLLTRAV